MRTMKEETCSRCGRVGMVSNVLEDLFGYSVPCICDHCYAEDHPGYMGPPQPYAGEPIAHSVGSKKYDPSQREDFENVCENALNSVSRNDLTEEEWEQHKAWVIENWEDLNA